MKLPVYNQEGKEIETIELDAKIFDMKVNADLLHQVAVSQESNTRKVIADARDRAEVSGGGKKPWRQKGTGRARHGSIRSPIWKGGGVTHGPTSDRNFKKKVNKKMATKALVMAISAKAHAGNLVILDDVSMGAPKTKIAFSIIKNLSKQKSLAKLFGASKIVVLPERDPAMRAFRNIEKLVVQSVSSMTALEVLKNAFVVMPKAAIELFEKRVK